MSSTEQVTVLFTDLVGSTELSSALAPDAADELRRTHFSSLRQAIAASGGTEVKNLGDGLMVVFNASSAALQCAVQMQQAVVRANAAADRPLGLRVGLSAGEATREGDDYFGDPVIEASRLCAKADGGQILATDLVRATAGRRSAHNFAPVGSLELKGLPDPIETCEVTWAPLDAVADVTNGVPLPGRLAHRPEIGVIGRTNELEILETTAKHAASGGGRAVVLIGGEPGQGKTTLVAELARRQHEAGATVLLGRSDEDVGAPYHPFHEALGHLVAHADEQLLRAHVATHGAELSRLVPALRQRLGELPPLQEADPDTERYLLFAAVVALLGQATEDRPVLLVLDDLHWADKPTLQLLRHVIANTAAQRLVVLGTYRDAELSNTHPLTDTLAALHREPNGVTSLSLRGLDDTGVIEFMESAAGHDLDDAGVALAHDLYRETDGNPFFVAEMLRNLSESGAIYQDETGRWRTDSSDGHFALPHSVRSVIGARVSRLGEEATKVLSAASVIGREFDLDLLAESTQVDEDTLIDLLEEAQHAAVVVELAERPGRYSFAHALINHTLYEDLGINRRTRLHRTVGEALERLYGAGSDERVGELARHFLMATRPADAEKAIAYAHRAGAAALAALAPDDAVRYFSQALELAGESLDPRVRVEMLVGLGSAQRQSGIAACRETLLEAARRARELGDTEHLVAAALANNRGLFSALGEVDTEKVGVLEAALAALPEADGPERARLLATLCCEVLYRNSIEERLELYREAKAMARRLGDEATFVDVVTRCVVAVRAPSTLDELLDDATEAIAAAQRLNDPVALCQAAHVGVQLSLHAAQFDVARERATLNRTLAARIGQPTLSWQAAYIGALFALAEGDLERAEALATEALEVGTAGGQPDAFGFYAIQLMNTRHQQGRLGELLPIITEAVEQHPTIPSYNAVLALAHYEAGDLEVAKTLLDRAAADSFPIVEDVSWFDAATNYGVTIVALRLVSYAQHFLDLLAPFHDQFPNEGLAALEPVALTLGGLAEVLARYDEAEAYFAESLEVCTRGGVKHYEGRTLVDWSRMLMARAEPGDHDRAREMLERARAISAEKGYGRIARQATAALSQLG